MFYFFKESQSPSLPSSFVNKQKNPFAGLENNFMQSGWRTLDIDLTRQSGRNEQTQLEVEGYKSAADKCAVCPYWMKLATHLIMYFLFLNKEREIIIRM